MSDINRYTPLPAIKNDSSDTDNTSSEDTTTGQDEIAYDEDETAGGDLGELDLTDTPGFVVLSKVRQKATALSGNNDYSSRDFLVDMYYISLASNKTLHDRSFGKKLGETLTTLNFVELFGRMCRQHMGEELFEMTESDFLWINFDLFRGVMHNVSDKSNEFCERIIKTNLHSEMIGHLNSEYLNPSRLHQKNRATAAASFVGILHNVVQRAAGAREAFRECNCVDVMQTFRNCENQMIRCIAVIIQAYIITEEENEKINSDGEVFDFLVQLLSIAMTPGSIFSVIEEVEAINKMAASDKNKVRIVEAGVLPYYVQLLAPDRPEEQQKLAAHGLWILAFKCKQNIQSEPGCVKALKALLERSTSADIKKEAEGALWILENSRTSTPEKFGNKNPTQNKDETGDLGDAKGHIFISYQWDAKPTVLEIRDRLKEAGLVVWIDEDNMSGSVLEAMALAVEKASIVVVCLSQKYKDSPSCRTEAEYTFRLHKKIVPLRLQTNYYPDGWLGALAGSKLVFDFSQTSKVENSIKHLIRELGNFGKESTDEVDSPKKTIAMRRSDYPSHEKTFSTNDWTRDDIDSWISKNNLEHFKDWLSTFTGPLLMEYSSIRHDAPEAFFTELKEKNFPLTDRVQLSKALKELT